MNRLNNPVGTKSKEKLRRSCTAFGLKAEKRKKNSKDFENFSIFFASALLPFGDFPYLAKCVAGQEEHQAASQGQEPRHWQEVGKPSAQ
jgi:hypothetical protein